ncbi:MAG: DUF1573 domain-containing protein [Pirellulaceae bacterium]|nr:DUF1573 domain-containing protein [Pirellulaceae bacterium]
MRKLLISCAIIAQGLGVVCAQSISDVIPQEQRHHDFGAVAKASRAEHRFVLHNPFSTDLVIQSVRASCGCTTPVLETQVIKPGQSGSLMAKFNTDRFNGEKKATLTLSIAQPYSTELQLNVRGYIRTDVVLQPGEAVFGSVPEASRPTLTLDLNYAGRSDWQVLDISCPFAYVKASFTEVSRGGGRVRYTIEISLEPSAPEGYLESQLVVHTNDNRLKTLPIRLAATIEKPLRVAPATIALGRVKPHEPIPQRLTITSKSDFRISDIKSEIAEIRFDSPGKPSRVHMLPLVIAPNPLSDFSEGEVKGKILVHIDTSETPIEVPLSYTLESDKLADAQLAP